MPASPPLHPRDIALVKMSALGDVVHALPVANALKRVDPSVRLTWIVQPVPYQLLRGHAAVDEFVLFERRRGVAGLGSFLELRRKLAHRSFDLVLDLQVAFKAGLVTALLHAPVKLGFDRRRARDLNWMFTTHRIPPRPPRHIQDEYLEFLEYLGVEAQPVEWGLEPSAEERAAQHDFFAPIDKPACGVVVGTSKSYKDWPPKLYARLLEALESDFGLRPMLLGGPAQRRAADEVLQRSAARPIDALAGDVRRLLWRIDGCRLVIAPDTGPLHIARALDVPVVGLYGYTNPKRWGPYGKYQDLVVDGYARWSGEDYGFSPDFRPDGMQRIRLEAVLEKVDRALHLRDVRHSGPGSMTGASSARGASPAPGTDPAPGTNSALSTSG